MQTLSVTKAKNKSISRDAVVIFISIISDGTARVPWQGDKMIAAESEGSWGRKRPIITNDDR